MKSERLSYTADLDHRKKMGAARKPISRAALGIALQRQSVAEVPSEQEEKKEGAESVAFALTETLKH